MAFSTKSSLFLFFVALVLLSSQIQGRESYFFGKFHRETPKEQNPNSEKITVEEDIPNKKDQEHEPTFVSESENGYGLYGREPFYKNNKENKEEFNNNNKYDGETFSTPSLSEKEESFNNNDDKYTKKTESNSINSYNNEEFNNNKYDETVKEEFNNNNKYDGNVKEESYKENNEDKKRSFYNSNAYGSELESETPYKGYSHDLERQGMSDTRFMEKGNNYYDLYNDRNQGYYFSDSYGKNNNKNEDNSFKDPYNSKWEKNLRDEQSEEFAEEQNTTLFKP